MALPAAALKLVVLVLGVWAAESRELMSEISTRHEQWMAQYGRVYKDATEKQHRFEVFKANVELIETFNAGRNHKYKLGTNQFADLTNQEFNAIYNGLRPSPPKASTSSFRYENTTTLPSSIDWRSKGAVTPIKDQGQCGCCWAFSAVAATEGISQIKTGKLISLAEQELVDCDVNGQDQGCNGGLMDNAFEFIIQNGGLTTEAKYPYQGTDGTCNTNKASSSAASISGYEDVPANDESALKKAVAGQPISGCCWAFSAVAATEGISQIKTGKLISLAEQELVDCDVNGQDQGCNGGLMDNAFEFIIQNGGLTTEAKYPYQGTDGTCNTNKASSSAASISGYEDVPANDESALKKAVAGQPISVAIDASGSAFQLYSSGVFTGDCGTSLDHGVTAVGYGTSSDGTKYWLVKNSWGSSWGENGYIRMERGIDANEGLCGIAMQASYPTA